VRREKKRERERDREGENMAMSSRRAGYEREFFIDNLVVRIHFIIVMVGLTGLAPWEFAFPFPGSLAYTLLVLRRAGHETL